jgi:hypothetical protein
MLITGDSGSGKSYLMRKILEQVSRTTQTIVFDPEGEFASLREIRDMVLAGPGGEVPAEPRSASLLARRLIELRTSAVIDLSDLTIRQRQEFAAGFCETMVALPKSLWTDCFIVFDEAHELAGEGDKSVSEQALASLSVKGRKRGFCVAAATTRLSMLSKNVAAGLKNKFLGSFSLDADIKRAANDLGFGKEKWPEIRDLSSREGLRGRVLLRRPGVEFPRGAQDARRRGRDHAPQARPAEGRAAGAEQEDPRRARRAEGPTPAGRGRNPRPGGGADEDRELERQLRARPVEQVAKEVVREVSSKKDLATIARLRAGLEDAMKVIAEINAKGFEAAGIDPELVKQGRAGGGRPDREARAARRERAAGRARQAEEGTADQVSR